LFTLQARHIQQRSGLHRNCAKHFRGTVHRFICSEIGTDLRV
jgi:hypothetical protein